MRGCLEIQSGGDGEMIEKQKIEPSMYHAQDQAPDVLLIFDAYGLADFSQSESEICGCELLKRPAWGA